MKKRTVSILVGTVLAAGIGLGAITAVAAASTGYAPCPNLVDENGQACGSIDPYMGTASVQDAPNPYPVNENGQTYGGVMPFSTQEDPDLIAVIGIDGVEGYVYPADLDGDQPSNPEEALAYMEELEKAYAKAKETGEQYSRYIPVYDSDGVTVIGEFGISFPWG